MTKLTAPIGFDQAGAPIEEVVTTASRLPRIHWAALGLGAALGFLALQLLERPRPRRRVLR